MYVTERERVRVCVCGRWRQVMQVKLDRRSRVLATAQSDRMSRTPDDPGVVIVLKRGAFPGLGFEGYLKNTNKFESSAFA